VTQVYYGFRLYEVTLRRGRRQAVVPFHLCGSEDQPKHFRQVLLELLGDLQGRRLVGQPKVQSAEGAGVEEDVDAPLQQDLLGETVFRFQEYRASEGLIVGVLRRGRYGSHDVGIPSDDATDDVPLTGLAPSDWYRFVLNLPEQGSTAVLAIEQIGVSCPVDLFLKWLGQRSRELSEAAPVTDHERPWWRLIGHQVTDPDNLERLLREGVFGEVTLTKRATSSGRSRTQRAYTVSAPSVSESRLDDLRNYVRSWRRAEGSDEPPVSDAEGARQLATLISPDLEGIEFDDGQIAMPGSHGRPLKPSKLTELFTYDQNPPDRRSSGVAFYRSIRGNAARLAVLTEPDEPGLEWPVQVDLDF
jgi:hypothetical protein